MNGSFACRFDCGKDRADAGRDIYPEVNATSVGIGVGILSQEASRNSSRHALDSEVTSECERGVVCYFAPAQLPFEGTPLRSSRVWRYAPESDCPFRPVELSLYPAGFAISIPGDEGEESSATNVAWSPFALVQACRFHSAQVDAAQPCLKLFKISVFGRSAAYFFATEGEDADAERARWVADVARAIRSLTISLFPGFVVRVAPQVGSSSSARRLLAGYLLLSADDSVMLLYCELHAHLEDRVAFVVYEDESCTVQMLRLSVGVETWVTERVGVDCACFSIDGHQFAARTRSERDLWLRAVSNLRVKMKHRAANPTDEEIGHYRAAILEHVESLALPPEAVPGGPRLPPMLPRWPRQTSPPTVEPQTFVSNTPASIASARPSPSRPSPAMSTFRAHDDNPAKFGRPPPSLGSAFRRATSSLSASSTRPSEPGEVAHAPPSRQLFIPELLSGGLALSQPKRAPPCSSQAPEIWDELSAEMEEADMVPCAEKMVYLPDEHTVARENKLVVVPLSDTGGTAGPVAL